MHKRYAELWCLFASHALNKIANGDTSDKNHVVAARESGLYADEMINEFMKRFDDSEKAQEIDYADLPTFERGTPPPMDMPVGFVKPKQEQPIPEKPAEPEKPAPDPQPYLEGSKQSWDGREETALDPPIPDGKPTTKKSK